VLTGVAIAGYTLWDKHAVDDLALSPLVYYWGTNTANALLLTALVRNRRGSVRLAWQTSKAAAGGVALLSPLAYVLILFALARAPVSAVAPARELSILIGTLPGTTVLAEGEGARRAVASVAILAGVVALALG
jgi:drug/metabolite transporter (DMT)-like permease